MGVNYRTMADRCDIRRVSRPIRWALVDFRGAGRVSGSGSSGADGGDEIEAGMVSAVLVPAANGVPNTVVGVRVVVGNFLTVQPVDGYAECGAGPTGAGRQAVTQHRPFLAKRASGSSGYSAWASAMTGERAYSG